MAKDLNKEMDDDFLDIDILGNKTGSGAEARSTVQTRPVKKIEKVADDPLADSESTEDIYSGRYVRDTSDRGVYTGGTKHDRIMNSTDTAEERAARARRRKKESRRRAIITVVVILILLAVAAVVAVKKFGLSVKLGGSEETTTEAQTEAPTTEASTVAEETEEAIEVTWEKDGNEEITQLVKDYYAALVAGDTDTLSLILDEEAVTPELSEFVEDYQDISTYVTDGENEGEYAVYITYSMKIKDVETAAPGLVPAYVRTDSEGSLRLLNMIDIMADDTLNSYMTRISNSEAVKTLNEEVEAAYAQAQEEDADLKAFIESVSSTETGENAETSNEEGETSSEGADEETTTTAAETTTAAASDSTFETVDNMQYINADSVNLRKDPSMDGEFIQSLSKGTKVHVIATSESWYKVVLLDGNGTTGYVASQFLSEDPVETEAADED